MGRDPNPYRVRLQAGYEVIAIAINDQPLTLVFDVKGTYRNDFAPGPLSAANRLELTGEAGVRFSLWAPARRSVPLERVR